MLSGTLRTDVDIQSGPATRSLGAPLFEALLTLRLSDDYPKDGLCEQVDIDVFYPEEGTRGGEAKKICAMCDVKEKCLQYALKFSDSADGGGIWGGTTEKERFTIRAAQRRGIEIDFENLDMTALALEVYGERAPRGPRR